MYNFSRGGAGGAQAMDPYSYNMQEEDDENQYEYDYDYEYDDEEMDDQEEEDEDEIPLYMAKAEKTGGIGGLGLNRQNSLGASAATRAQSASGGSFYGKDKEKEKEKDSTKLKKSNSLVKENDPDPYSFGGKQDYGFGPDSDEEEGGGYYGSKQTKKPQSAPGQGKKGVMKKLGKDIEPKRFALKYDPPTIVLEYLVPASGKLYHHKMKLLKLKQETKNKDAIDYLKKKHGQFFIGGKIEDSQIDSLVDKLKKRLSSTKGGAKTQSKVGAGKTATNAKKKTGGYNYDAYDYDDDDNDFDY